MTASAFALFSPHHPFLLGILFLICLQIQVLPLFSLWFSPFVFSKALSGQTEQTSMVSIICFIHITGCTFVLISLPSNAQSHISNRFVYISKLRLSSAFKSSDHKWPIILLSYHNSLLQILFILNIIIVPTIFSLNCHRESTINSITSVLFYLSNALLFLSPLSHSHLA